MNNELIETFIAVAHINNISKASAILYVSQATVSYRLKQLEDTLGIPLILRNKGSKQTKLTAYGKRFLPLAHDWIKLNHEINTFKDLPVSLDVTIGLVDSINTYLFAGLYNKLSTDVFDWRLEIKTLHTEEIYNQISLNQIDIGFPLGQLILPEISTKKIFTETLMVISKHKIKQKSVLLPSDLDTAKQIYINWGNDYRHWHNQNFSSHETPNFSIDSATLAYELLSEDTWFFAPSSICMYYYQNHYNCYISTLALETPSRELYMVTNHLTEQLKRKQIVLFKRRVLQYIVSEQHDFEKMLDQFYTKGQKKRTSYLMYIHDFKP